METQYHTYSGNNTDNNRVWIDFEKKEIKYEPVPVKSKLLSDMLFPLQVYLLTFIFQFPLFVVFSILAVLDIYILALYILWIQVFTGILVSTVYAFRFNFIKKWRYNMFPIFNAEVNSSTIQPFFMISELKYQKVRKEAMIENMFIVPEFSNVVLDYILTGDYKKYIKSISIQNLYHKKDNKWNVVFMFNRKKKIKKGDFLIRYI